VRPQGPSGDSGERVAAGTQRALRLVGAVEALKGITVLVTATGLLALVHRDLNALAARLVRHAHLNPASELPHIFLDAVAHLDEPRLLWLALGAAAYGMLRLLEAYGLFHNRAWAEWLGALSGALYVPFEIVELLREPSLLTLALLIVNILVVAVMAWALLQRRSQRRAGAS
jgi:uncharacterized membrane protein (DUF2068 family)